MSKDMMNNFKEKFDSIKDEGSKKIHRISTKYPKIDKDDAILLIIDVQDRLAPAMQFKEESVKNINILIEMAKTYNMPIIATEQYPAGLGNTVEEISVNFDEDVTIVEKIRFSAYKDIEKHLEKMDRETVIVVGMETHVCVYQTARDLKYNGYNVFVPRDGVNSRYTVNFKNALDIMGDMGINITNTETVLFDIMEKAGTPEFKKLSKLIR